MLFNKYALNKNELYGYLGEYQLVPLGAVLYRMNAKGYVFVRKAETGVPVYSLTSHGLYEAQRRFNSGAFHELYDYILARGFESNNVSAFLRNKFYDYHIDGVREEGDVEMQYLKWCQANEMSLKVV